MALRDRLLSILPDFISKRFQSTAVKRSPEFDISGQTASPDNIAGGSARKMGVLVTRRTENPIMVDSDLQVREALKQGVKLSEPVSESSSARTSLSISTQLSDASASPRQINGTVPKIKSVAEYRQNVDRLEAITQAIRNPSTSSKEFDALCKEGSQICKALYSAKKHLTDDQAIPQSDRNRHVQARADFDAAVKTQVRAAPTAPQLK